jgi:hypothetical protein
MRLLTLFALLATLTAVLTAAAQADPDRNLEAILRPTATGPEKGFGLVEFRQPKDGEAVVHLDVWVRDLLPNHAYRVQRAAVTPADGNCDDASNWAMPELGTITTDERGTGRAALLRPLPPPAIGNTFDIHFRIVDPAAPGVAVLQSGCYEFTASSE